MSFDNIKLEKEMYGVCNKSFTSILESLDPSEDYRGTEFEGLDAYQRQLKRFGIKVTGPGCDIVEKFFETSESAVLFPEFVSRAVKSGMEINNIIPSMICTKIMTNSLDYRTLTTNVETVSGSSVAEAGDLPEVTIRTNSTLITLKKYGHMISTSYEALRWQNLDIFSLILRKLGSLFTNYQLNELVTAVGSPTPIIAEELTYGAMLSLWASIKPYHMNTLLMSYNTAKDVLGMSEFRDANAGLDFHGTGRDISPLGAKIVCTNSTSLADEKIIGFDSAFTFQMYQMDDLVVDYNSLIDKQLEKALVTLTFGFSKILSKSLKVLTYSE